MTTPAPTAIELSTGFIALNKLIHQLAPEHPARDDYNSLIITLKDTKATLFWCIGYEGTRFFSSKKMLSTLRGRCNVISNILIDLGIR